MPRDYEAIASDLLAPHQDDPPARARRIAAIYAALYLEDPLLHQWCGLASFVARHIAMGLETGLGPLQDPFADGNLAIYSDIVPAFFRFRDGAPVTGKLEVGFNSLRRADVLARRDRAAAEVQANVGLWELSAVEQTVICQPVYDRLNWVAQHLLAPFVMFRFGYDTASPIVKFDGWNPADLDSRLRWVKEEVLPTWARFHAENTEQIRADLDRVRREGEVRLSQLPAPLLAA